MAVYNVPESGAEKKENRFAFRIKDANGKGKDKVYSVPKLEFLSGETSEYIADLVGKAYNETTVTRNMLSLENPDCAEAVRKLRKDQVDALSAQWAEASAVTVGESSASES
ncbi:hypothetical protein CH253_08110 [Rhodococcus sp. 06-156-3C]|uniref:hypothetical protein n=1 Tax=Rhodococcus sp. 06-156-3C TaxID=2022486 RepID=UPI000B9AA2E7|nr:hypothetical protein [Rhodococcus sp. 06-156-3C]OZD23816.1 hypothetical protein CH253_08110 [Rhodococcus sp. 06-156-3C]